MPEHKPLTAHTRTHTRTTSNALNIINIGDMVNSNIASNALITGINNSTTSNATSATATLSINNSNRATPPTAPSP